MSVLVIMLLHANNIIFVGFWPNHFALSVKRFVTTTDRIFQDVAAFFLLLPLTNPHPLTLTATQKFRSPDRFLPVPKGRKDQ